MYENIAKQLTVDVAIEHIPFVWKYWYLKIYYRNILQIMVISYFVSLVNNKVIKIPNRAAIKSALFVVIIIIIGITPNEKYFMYYRC
jgi:hypothetical protein